MGSASDSSEVRSLELLSQGYFDRQVHLYESVLEAGAARGEIELAAPVQTIARGFVSMEDGLGFQVVIGHPGIGPAEAERILLRYGSAMMGLDREGGPWPDQAAGALAE